MLANIKNIYAQNIGGLGLNHINIKLAIKFDTIPQHSEIKRMGLVL
jgi:hypothetical protein